MKPSCFSLLPLVLLAGCSSTEPTPIVKHAEQLRKSGHPIDAIELLDGAQAQTPDDPLLLQQLGLALLDANQTKAASQIFDRVIALAPDNAGAYNGKGIVADRLGHHEDAQKFYEHALSLTPGAINIENNVAMSFILSRHYDEAIAVLEKIRADKRDNKTIRQNLALAYGLKGDKAKSLESNLIDLTPEEAKKTMASYADWAAKHKGKKPA